MKGYQHIPPGLSFPWEGGTISLTSKFKGNWACLTQFCLPSCSRKQAFQPRHKFSFASSSNNSHLSSPSAWESCLCKSLSVMPSRLDGVGSESVSLSG